MYTSHTKQTVRVRVVYLQPAVYGVRKTPLPANIRHLPQGPVYPKHVGGRREFFTFAPPLPYISLT